MKISNLRIKFITNEPAQLKYLATMILSMLIPLCVVGGCLYFLIINIMAEQLGIPEYIAYNLVPVIKKINTILMVGLPPLVLLLLFWGVILSHRFAGPLQRLRNEVDEIAKSGEYTRRLRLRKHDDLKPLIDSFNRLMDKVCEDRRK